jgi:shikimate kinase
MHDRPPPLRGRILITGPSGSGKSTLARHLRRQGTLAVDADAIPGLGRLVDRNGRPLRRITHDQYLKVDGWDHFWDEATLASFLSRNPHIVVCGVSGNIFDLDLARLFDRRISLSAPWSVIDARLNDPKRDNDRGRDTRPAQRDRVRSAVRTWTPRAQAAGFELVDATLPIETIRLIRESHTPTSGRGGRSRPTAKGGPRYGPTLPAPLVIAQVPCSEYKVTDEPDFNAVGPKIDQAIESTIPDGTYIVRAIGIELDKDPGLLEDMVAILLDKGTDKFDPKRRGVAHEEFSGYDYDIYASRVKIERSRLVRETEVDPRLPPSWFGGTAWHFYHGATLDRGHPVRLDLLIFYDPRKVIRARKKRPHATGVRAGLARHLYRFKDRRNKRSALLGLIEILR